MERKRPDIIITLWKMEPAIFYLLDPSSGYQSRPNAKNTFIKRAFDPPERGDTYESLLQTMADQSLLDGELPAEHDFSLYHIRSAVSALTHEVFHLLAGCAFSDRPVDLIWLLPFTPAPPKPLRFPVRHSRGSQDSSSEQPARFDFPPAREKTLTRAFRAMPLFLA